MHLNWGGFTGGLRKNLERERADSITGNGTKRNGGRKKFNVNFIVMISVFFV